MAGAGNATYSFTTNWTSIVGVQGSLVGATSNTGSMAFDEFRIGTSAADMFSAIPEPSTSLLTAFAASALLLRRRRA